jgi:hypothetical protein
MQSEAGDPLPEPVEDGIEPADRDERRVKALERMFRRAYQGERRLSVAAMKKVGAALRGEPAIDEETKG